MKFLNSVITNRLRLQRLARLGRSPHTVNGKSNNQGFTLTELLIAMMIASGIISGLMYLVIELLTADHREAARSQTQQEMQMAMDYIAAELREAVYVYEGACLNSTGAGNRTAPDSQPPYCPGLYNHIPDALKPTRSNYPILAFWKQQPLPATIRQQCTNGNAPQGTPCSSGHSYALVIYSLNTTNPHTWDGRSRINRYMLSEFSSTGARNAGYVNPANYRNNFRSWPVYREANATGTTADTPTNRQTTPPGANGSNPAVLVDFVDDGAGAIASGVNMGAACPTTSLHGGVYVPTFDAVTFTGSIATAPGFYACVNSNSGDINYNSDVLLYVRGNAAGRPGLNRTAIQAFLPVLETRVFSRPVLGKSPVQ